MKTRINVLLTALIILIIFPLTGFCVEKNAQVDKNTKVIVTGNVISKGNVPFVEPYIKTLDGKEYKIICNQKTQKKLLNAQGQKIKFTGYIQDDGKIFLLKKWKKI